MRIRIRIFFSFMVWVMFLASCENSINKKSITKQKIDYTNKTVLDSLIKSTPHSKDTLFLGFTIGMNKTDYKNHIQKLRNEGKTLDYSNSYRISTHAGKFDLGSGYAFITSISTELSGKNTDRRGGIFS